LDILTLHRAGPKQRAIARKLDISRNTVKKYIDKPELAFEPSQRRKRRSQLVSYQDNIQAWIEERYQL
jgi:transposase